MTSEAAGAAQSRAKIFISYSRKDMVFADRLEAALRARGFEPLIDRTDIYAFEDWWTRIEALIARADTVVFVLSPDSAASDVARKEIAFAASLNKRFAPILLRPVSNDAVPDALAKLNFLFFDDEARFDASADRLAEALDTDIGWIRQHTAFGEQARHWVLAKGPRGLLLHSPVLEQAERWIAARPRGAPAPTEETQVFIRASRQDTTRRRNILTGSLAAGLVVALGLAGLAYWQRGLAVEQRSIAQQNEAQAKDERDKATRNFRLAQEAAESMVVDIARDMRNVQGMSAKTVRNILDAARATFEQLAAAAPDDLSLQRSQSVLLDEFGLTYETLGELDAALKAYRDSLAIRERVVAVDRGNPLWQAGLSQSHTRVGDALRAQGKLEEALKSYRKGFAIMERLADADPSNTLWQRELTLPHGRIAEVLRTQGQLEEALKIYRKNLAITERLIAADPSNRLWQRDLGVSHIMIGDILELQGKLEEALKSYRDGLPIRERLVAADPGNTQSQFDLSTAYERVGNVLRARGKVEEALKSYRDCVAIVERLAAADPSDMLWQRELALAYERVAGVLVAQSKFEEALKIRRDNLAIMERLAAADPSNRHWQNDLAVLHMKIGQTQVRQGKLEEALKKYRDSLVIRERLAAADPSNTQWLSNLSVLYGEIGFALLRQRKPEEALKAFRDSFAIQERLAAADPSNMQWQSFLSGSYIIIGDALRMQGKLSDALKSYRHSVAIRTRLATVDPSNLEWQNDLQIAVVRIGGIAYNFLLDGNFAIALECADQAISLTPAQIWLYSNRAHALMYLGRGDEARAIYLRYRGEQRVSADKSRSWEAMILKDLAELRQAKLTHPLMDEIEALFASRP